MSRVLVFAALLLVIVALTRRRPEPRPIPTFEEYWSNPDAYSDEERRAATLGRLCELIDVRNWPAVELSELSYGDLPSWPSVRVG